MNVDPVPPYLLIRRAIAFSVQHCVVELLASTPQAFAEGCFDNSFIYDDTGHSWEILEAAMNHSFSPCDLVIPWRQRRTAIRLGLAQRRATEEVVLNLLEVLDSENEFCDVICPLLPLDEVRNRISLCKTPDQVIRAADLYICAPSVETPKTVSLDTDSRARLFAVYVQIITRRAALIEAFKKRCE